MHVTHAYFTILASRRTTLQSNNSTSLPYRMCDANFDPEGISIPQGKESVPIINRTHENGVIAYGGTKANFLHVTTLLKQ